MVVQFLLDESSSFLGRNKADKVCLLPAIKQGEGTALTPKKTSIKGDVFNTIDNWKIMPEPEPNQA